MDDHKFFDFWYQNKLYIASTNFILEIKLGRLRNECIVVYYVNENKKYYNDDAKIRSKINRDFEI